MQVTSGLPKVTHQFFFDDTMLFGVYLESKARNFKKILDKYSMASGHEVSIVKSKVFFFNTMMAWKELQTLRTLKFRKRNLPCKYLGLSITKGVSSRNI